MKSHRIGLVGAGSMGALHARVIAQSLRADLAFVADPDRATGESLAHRFETVWQLECEHGADLDGLVIASPTETHRQLALDAIHAGTPLLVEKPLAETLTRAREIVEASERAGVPIMCGLLERFNPTIMTAMDFVDTPLHISTVRHSPYVARIRTGVAADLLIHDVDLVLRLAGTMPATVISQIGYFHPGSARGSEDSAESYLGFASGLLASCSASRMSQRKIRTVSITELDRLVELDLLRQDITVYRHVGNDIVDEDVLGYRQQTIIDIPVVRYRHEPLAAQLDRFLDLLEGLIDPDDERRSLLPAHEVVDTALRSARARD